MDIPPFWEGRKNARSARPEGLSISWTAIPQDYTSKMRADSSMCYTA